MFLLSGRNERGKKKREKKQDSVKLCQSIALSHSCFPPCTRKYGGEHLCLFSWQKNTVQCVAQLSPEQAGLCTRPPYLLPDMLQHFILILCQNRRKAFYK